MDSPRGVSVRSYRDVVDVVERRIFRIDRWRLPTPHGVSVRRSPTRAPASSELRSPAGCRESGSCSGYCRRRCSTWRCRHSGDGRCRRPIDGRRPHHALVAALRHRQGPRAVAGLRRVPPVGSRVAPVAAIQIASSDDGRYRAGRVRGPATLTLRYPAEITVERGRRPIGGGRDPGMIGARRVRVRPLSGRALLVGRELRVPEGGEVVVE